MEGRDQNNLKFLLSMDEGKLSEWLGEIPEEYFSYIEWLLDRVETIILEKSEYKDANSVIQKIKEQIAKNS